MDHLQAEIFVEVGNGNLHGGMAGEVEIAGEDVARQVDLAPTHRPNPGKCRLVPQPIPVSQSLGPGRLGASPHLRESGGWGAR